MYIYIYVYIDSQKPSIQESVWRQPRSAFLTTSQLTGKKNNGYINIIRNFNII